MTKEEWLESIKTNTIDYSILAGYLEASKDINLLCYLYFYLRENFELYHPQFCEFAVKIIYDPCTNFIAIRSLQELGRPIDEWAGLEWLASMYPKTFKRPKSCDYKKLREIYD